MATSPRVSCRMQEIILPIIQQHDGRRNRPTRSPNPVPTTGKVPDYRLPDGILQSHLPQPENLALPVRDKGVLVVPCAETRTGHRFLRTHSKFDHIEQAVQGGLILQVSPGHTDRHHRHSILEDQGRRQSNPGALARLDPVGMPGRCVETAKSIAMSNSKGSTDIVRIITARRGGDDARELRDRTVLPVVTSLKRRPYDSALLQGSRVSDPGRGKGFAPGLQWTSGWCGRSVPWAEEESQNQEANESPR